MTPLQALLTIAFGAVAGGLTNSIAIWMLFHPYEPPAIGRRRLRGLQGAIPKNKERLASALGRTVGNQLLTPADVARAIERPGFRAAFDERLGALLVSILDQPRGSLREELPADVAEELQTLLGDVAHGLLDRLDDYLRGDDFRRVAHGWAERLAAELADRPIGDLLTDEREATLADAAERWIREVGESPGFEDALTDYLERATERLLVPDRTFEEILPTGLVVAVERAIAGYLPIAIERLGRLLEDPDTRAKVEQVLHEVLDRFMRDLRFHQRLVAALVITPETVDKVLGAVEAEGANKIAELLRDESVRDAMARNVNDAIVDFLRKPVRSVLGGPRDESVVSAQATVRRNALAIARDEQTRAFLVEKLRSTLTAAERRTWGDLFRHVPPERIADLLVSAARSERAAELYRDAAEAIVSRLLSRRIGRVADHLPPDSIGRIETALAEPVWSWIREQAPGAVEKLDVARRVEDKVLEFPPQRVEKLIRDVTDRELKLIVRLGYLLGAVIGGTSVAINLLLG